MVIFIYWIAGLACAVLAPVVTLGVLRSCRSKRWFTPVWLVAALFLTAWAAVATIRFIQMLEIQARRPAHIPGAPGAGFWNALEYAYWLAVFFPSFPALIVAFTARRKRLQLRLIDLLLVTFMLAGLLGIRYRCRQHDGGPPPAELARWREIGAYAGIDPSRGLRSLEFFRDPGPLDALPNETALVAIDLRARRLGKEQFKYLSLVPDLAELDLSESNLDDAALLSMRGSTVSKLYLRGTEITSRGAEALATFENLQFVDLSDTAVTDEALTYFHDLKYLNAVVAKGTSIDGTGCKSLRDMSRRSYLAFDFEGSNFNDAGLDEAIEIKALKRLHIRRTRVTAGAVAKARAKLKAQERSLVIDY